MVVAEPRYAEEVEHDKDFPIRTGLAWEEKKLVRELRTVSRGVELVFGEAGGGKDLYAMFKCAAFKYYFYRRCLLDFLPCQSFDRIDGGPGYVLFNAEVMMTEISKMAKLARVEGIMKASDLSERDEFITEATHHWATEGEGEALLKGSILYLSELKRYCYNRTPHNPFNKFIGKICDLWRHLDLLIIGTHILPHEIDQYTFLSKSKIRAKCTWSLSVDDTTKVEITRRALPMPGGVFQGQGRPLTLWINGRTPRQFLNGKSVFELYVSKNYVNLKPVVGKEPKGE
jgi:hypothetical protein